MSIITGEAGGDGVFSREKLSDPLVVSGEVPLGKVDRASEFVAKLNVIVPGRKSLEEVQVILGSLHFPMFDISVWRRRATKEVVTEGVNGKGCVFSRGIDRLSCYKSK